MFPYPFGFLQSGDAVDPAFIMKINTNSTSNFKVPCTGTGYNYDVDWGDGSSDTGQTTSITHTYGSDGDYIVTITGTFPRIYFNNGSEKLKLQEIQNWGTGAWTTMDRAFYGCSNMTITATDTADFSALGGVVASLAFYYTFGNCSSMTAIPNCETWLSGQPVGMPSMFYGCSGLTTIDVANWDVSNVTDLNATFRACTSLTSLDVSNWNTSSVTGNGFWRVFNSCYALPSLDVSGWDVSGVTNLQEMFEDCRALTSLDLSSWNVSNITSFSEIFRDCNVLTTPGDLSSWNMSSATNLNAFLYNSPEVTTIGNVDGWNVSNVTNMQGAFYNCDKLILNVPSWNTSSVTNFEDTFLAVSTGVGSITGYNSWNVSNSTTFRECFYGASSGNVATLPTNWDMRSATTFFRTFRQWDVITGSIDMSTIKWDSTCTNMWDMFRNNTGLTDITFGSNNDFSGVTTMQEMFRSCSALTDITWDAGLDLSALTNATNMVLGGKMSTTSYNLFLIALDTTGSGTPGSLNAGTSTYSAAPSAAATAHASLNTKGWAISDGGPV